MTRSQSFLIAAVIAFFGFVVLVFRPDLFEFANRPGVTKMLQNWVLPYGKAAFLLLFAYFLAKTFNLKWWIFIVAFCVWELAYPFMFYVGPKFLPEKAKLTAWLGHFKSVALDYRSMPQYQDDTAQFDEELFYTLKPGHSRFKSYEFGTSYDNNSLGVRDDEADLDYPEILFLGDSFSMGWGVEVEEAYPNLFEKETGLKTLNTGISSYGTAREYRLMARVKTDSLKVVILQYHDTDLEENHFFVKNGRLGDRTREDFDFQVKFNKNQTKYSLFKYVSNAFVKWVASLKSSSDITDTEQALTGVYSEFPDWLEEFYVIYNKIQELREVPFILTYTGSFFTDPRVIEEFKAYAQKHDIKNIHFVNMGGILNHEDYFFFDDHINAKGHQKVADELLKKYRELGL